MLRPKLAAVDAAETSQSITASLASHSTYILRSNELIEENLGAVEFADTELGHCVFVGFGDGRLQKTSVIGRVEVSGSRKANHKPEDQAQEKVYDHTMSDMNREELNAKLEAVEARMDGRVASIEGKIDAFLAAQTQQQRFNEHRFDSYEKSVGEMRTEIKTDFKSLRNTIIVTAVSTVLAIVIGVAGFNATLTSNMLSAFQFGKAASTQPPPVIPVNK